MFFEQGQGSTPDVLSFVVLDYPPLDLLQWFMKLIMFPLVILRVLAVGLIVPLLFLLSQLSKMLPLAFLGISDELLTFKLVIRLINQGLEFVP